MFGADGYASKIKLPDFIETAFLPVGHMRGWGKRDKIKALQDLQTRVATIIEKLDSAQ